MKTRSVRYREISLEWVNFDGSLTQGLVRIFPWGIFLPLWLVFLALFSTYSAVAQVSEVDERKVDELILLDISGSMVEDIRISLMNKGLARVDIYQNFHCSNVRTGLNNPAVQSAVKSNLLYKVIQYLEALIDQPGARNIYIATFDDGIRVLGSDKLPDAQRNKILGPFIIAGADEASSPARRRIKSFLDPDRFGVYEGAPHWRGVLAEAVMSGYGPTAIHRTCQAGLGMLKSLIVPGYTNSTRGQRMILLTDGIEEKDKQIPFTATIDELKLYRNNIAFEFDKIFMQAAGISVPGEIQKEDVALKNAGFRGIDTFKPRIIRVTPALEGAVLSGIIEDPRDENATVKVVLSPDVKFQVTADDNKPVAGRLKFSAKGRKPIPNMSVDVTPSEIASDRFNQTTTFSLTIKGSQLTSLFQADAKVFDELLLWWELADNDGGSGLNQAFYGPDRWPISLKLVRASPVVIRCLQPPGIDLVSDKPMEITSPVKNETLATFEADFSKTHGDSSIKVRLSNPAANNGIKLTPGDGRELLLTKGAGGEKKQVFSLALDAPPGAVNLTAALAFIPQSQGATVNVSNSVVNVTFIPSSISAKWLSRDGVLGNQPNELDYGEALMEPVPDRDGKVDYARLSIDTLSLTVPSDATSPAVEWVLTGEHPEAFLLTDNNKHDLATNADPDGKTPNLIDRSVTLQIQPRHFYVESKLWVITNLSATLEIRPHGNFFFSSAEAPQTKLISVPLKLTAKIPPNEGGGQPK